MSSIRKRRQLAFEALASIIQEGQPEERQRRQLYESFMRVMAQGAVVPGQGSPELLRADPDDIPLAPRSSLLH